MSEAKELEILRAKKAELEVESRTLIEIHKNIENRVKALEEQVAIKELQKNNKALREIVNQMKSKKAKLEKKLKEKTKTQESSAPKENTLSKSTNPPKPPLSREANETGETPAEENLEEIVAFEDIDPESLLANEEIVEIQEKPQEKKKRRLFGKQGF